MEALLAGAVPLSEFLVERAIERAGGRGRDAGLEAKLAAVRELKPFLMLAPEGLARTVFEDAVARRLDLDAGALRAELSGRRQPAGGDGARAPGRGGVRPTPAAVTVVLPGPAADALGLLAAYPDLAEIAAEEGLPLLLPPGPLADLARDLVGGKLGTEEALGRLGALADERVARRLRALAGPGRPRPEEAARELRKAAIKASIEAIRVEQDRLLAQVARKGSPVPEELQTKAQIAARRRSDLEKRLRSLERGTG